jgi:hypothetical protein
MLGTTIDVLKSLRNSLHRIPARSVSKAAAEEKE